MYKSYTLKQDNHSFIFKVNNFGVDLFEAVEDYTCGQSIFLLLKDARIKYRELVQQGYKLTK